MCCLGKLLVTVLQSFSVVIAVLALFALVIYIFKYVWSLIFSKERKHTDGYQEQWFGKDPSPLTNDGVKMSADDVSIKPFKINVSEDVLADLKSRLDRTRYEDPVADSKFQYGFNPNYLRKLVDYWRKEYDWRKHEQMLNKFPQYKTRIEGIDINFLHVKPDLPADSNLSVLPLMLIHGWPGSIVEFYKIIPLLTSPRPDQDFVFEVICPSIPGFGFSESPHRQGFTVRAAARVFITLMVRFGHRKFYVQGGDFGSAISNLMARYYPNRILGLHLNLLGIVLRPWEAVKYLVIAMFPFLVSKAEYETAYPIKRIFKIIFQEGGYFHMQATKPDTLGCGMADSPAGMAAYVIEKFAFWTNPEYLKLEDGGLTKNFNLDELLTNVMLYWINNNFTAAARFYKENIMDSATGDHQKVPVTVPTGVAVFPNEMLMFPRTCLSQQMKNIISYNMMPRGGHFAALEEPELLADDVWNFVSIVEK